MAAAEKLLGTWYRVWYEGDSLPMWQDDGYTSAPPLSYFQSHGVMCSDLFNFARQECGLDPIGGVAAYGEALVQWSNYNPAVPGVIGGLVVARYVSPALAQQGHVAMICDENQTLIQATVLGGVNEYESDAQSDVWAGFDWYGLMPDVDYSQSPASEAPPWARNGWYQVEDNRTLTPQGVI